MGMFVAFVIVVKIIVANGVSITSEFDSLIQCSKYHFEEKVLEKLVRLEFKIENQEKLIAKFIGNLNVGLDKIENLKQSTEIFVENQTNKLDNTQEKLQTDAQKTFETAIESMNNTVSRYGNRIESYDKLMELKLEEIAATERERNLISNRSKHDLEQSFGLAVERLDQKLNAGLAKFKKDSDKRSTKPIVAFSAYRSTPHGGNGIVKYGNVWTNKGDAYNPSTGVFTAPKPGIYNFVVVGLSVSGKTLCTHLWHNTTYTAGTHLSGKDYKSGTIDIILDIEKGDQVYVKSRISSIGQIYSDTNNYSTFSG